MANKRKLQRNRPPTIIDVAKEAKVGVMSVSRVINDHPSVKASTRARVMNAISKTGYTPNDAARMLKGRTGRTIGLVVPDLSDFFASCFHAVQEVAIRHSYHTLVVATGKSAVVEDTQLESIQKHRVAGLLIVSSGSDGRRLKAFQDSGIPVVALDRPVPGLQADAVLVENRDGAEQGVRHLIEHGHKKIACVGFNSGSYTINERIEGYKLAMRGAGLRPILVGNVNTLQAMHDLVLRWKTAKDRPTAVFTVKRISSVFLVQSLHLHKLRVPEDIAIVGFDDFELAEVLGTPLTVVRQSPTEIARAAAELLFKKIANLREGSHREMQTSKILFPAQLILRRSCGCSGTE
ncbi:MAG: LacI family DNA-binding transcriptional regulator [Terracidiphilus sp.]|jgi:LacI family transcriptional regulator